MLSTSIIDRYSGIYKCVSINYFQFLWRVSLTHLPLDKMAAILADDNLKCNFLDENNRIPIRISLKFVPMSPIDNKPALVQVIAWCRIGDKPLPELMLIQFTDAYMRHRGRWVNWPFSSILKQSGTRITTAIWRCRRPMAGQLSNETATSIG